MGERPKGPDVGAATQTAAGVEGVIEVAQHSQAEIVEQRTPVRGQQHTGEPQVAVHQPMRVRLGKRLRLRQRCHGRDDLARLEPAPAGQDRRKRTPVGMVKH